jgi:cell wall-associated NlpC family hydrolase
MDTWSSGGTAAALSQMGWGETSPSVGGRRPGEPFQLAGSSEYGIGQPRWPLFGITPQDVQDAKFGANQAQANYDARVAQQQQQMGGSTQGATATGSGASMGGDWGNIDKLNGYISQAAAATGVDPNYIKAIMKLESDGVWQTSPAGAIGYMQVMPFWGQDFGLDLQDPYQNILAGAKVIKQNLDQHGGDFREALRAYHGYGWDGYTDDNQYADIVMGNYNTLRAYGGATANLPGGGMAPATGAGGNNVVNIAMSYVNKVPYVLGGIPGKGETPFDEGGGWDCSGMTYWLDQNYGSGQLPMGSHYQYQYAQQTGRLFTDLSQLQPGDLIFINTGWMGGAGSELNTSGHVAMYAGNGKIVQAANPSMGTVISDLQPYLDGSYGTGLGAMHMSWSGGAAGAMTPGAGQGTTPQQVPGGFGFTNFWLNQYGR